ncbi:MAG: hypothetical protein ACOYEN_04690, partial [Limnochordia bacterium]
DTVFLLGNGGGKTLLVQLILQTILPNERLGTRRIADLLQSQRFTGHVAVEWLLDSAGRSDQFLCTGFCFTNGLSTDEPIRYFNYLFDYEVKGPANVSLFTDEEPDQLTIEELPFTIIDEAFGTVTPIQYQRLWDWLEARSDTGVQLFRQRKAYQQRLRMYQIYAEEWENIRTTNSTEGGVSRFFERSKTTPQLLDQLLIPSIEQVIFQSEDRKRELFLAFFEHQNMLLQIPLIKQNIKDFGVIKEQAEVMVKEVQRLHQTEVEYQTRTDELISLAKTFLLDRAQTQQQIEALIQDMESQRATLADLEWKQDSYRVHEQRLLCQQVRQQKDQAQEQLSLLGEQLEKTQIFERQLQTLEQYHHLQEASKERQHYTMRLELMEQGEPELRQAINLSRGKLRFAWEEEVKQLNSQIEAAQGALAQIGELLNEMQDTAQGQNTLLQESISRAGELRGWLAQYKVKQTQAVNQIPGLNLLMPTETKVQLEAELTQGQQKREALQGEMDSLLEQDEQLVQRTIALEGQLQLLKADLEKRSQDLTTYNKHRDRLCGLLAAARIYTEEPLGEREELLLRVDNLWQRAQNQWIDARAKLANLEETWATIEDQDYYVPHRELRTIKQRLDNLGLPVVLGSQWLSEYFSSEEERILYLKQQPLTPFGLIIEANQIAGVRRALGQMKDLSCDYPLLFLVKQMPGPNPADTAPDLVSFGPNGLYIFLPDTLSAYTSKVSFKELKEQLHCQIQKMQLDSQGLKDAVGELAYLKQQTENFFDTYTPKQLSLWEEEVISLKQQCESIQMAVVNVGRQRKDHAEQRRRIEHHLTELAEEQKQLERTLRQLEDYLEWHGKYATVSEEEQRLTAKISVLNRELAETKKKQDNLLEKQVKSKGLLNGLEGRLADHRKEYTTLRLDAVTPIECSDGYSKAKAALEAITEQLAHKHAERQDLESLLSKATEACNQAQASIEASGISQEWLRLHLRPVRVSELAEASNATTKAQEQYTSQERVCANLGANLAAKEQFGQFLSEEVEKKFQREPYTGFSPENHKVEYDYLLQSVTQVQQGISNIQQEVTARREWQVELSTAIELIEERVEAMDHQLPQHETVDWRQYGPIPRQAALSALKEQEEASRCILRQRMNVERQFLDYHRRLQETRNPKVNQFLRDVQAIMDEGRIFDYDFVETQFLRIFEAMDFYQQQAEATLKQCKTNFNQLVQLCLRRAGTVYESIMQLPKNSRVTLYDRQIQVIRIEWSMQSEDEALHAIEEYLQKLLIDLQAWKEQGLDDDEINKRMEDMLSTRNLINVVAPIETCQVTVYKPRKESIARMERPDYFRWDDVSRWSGGEEYSVYITMFMIMLTHIRQQSEGLLNSWKVLLADNPFGVASSAHILDTMFQVARANRIQLLCLTAHKEEGILQHFPVVYSLQLRTAYGKEIMTGEQMEKGFYFVESGS